MTDIVDELRARALQGRFNLEAADEIERLRAELSEQCRLLGMSGEREAKHLAQIAALEKERDALRAKIETAENDAAHQKALAASALRVAEGWERKCGELRAKAEQMEKQEQEQEPVAWIVRGGYPVPLDKLEWQLWYGSEKPTLSWVNQEMRPLYALPGAKGE